MQGDSDFRSHNDTANGPCMLYFRVDYEMLCHAKNWLIASRWSRLKLDCFADPLLENNNWRLRVEFWRILSIWESFYIYDFAILVLCYACTYFKLECVCGRKAFGLEGQYFVLHKNVMQFCEWKQLSIILSCLLSCWFAVNLVLQAFIAACV